MKSVKKSGAVLLAIFAGISVPILIWVALIIAIRQIFVEWRVTRVHLLSGNIACNISSDCPPGYQCTGGRCLPAWSQ